MSAAARAVEGQTPGRSATAVLLVAWLAFVVGFFVLVFFSGTYSGSGTSLRQVTQVITIVAFGAWVLAAFRGCGWWPRRRALWPGLVGLGGMLLSAVFSPEPRLALGGLVVAACCLAAYLFLDRLSAHPFFRPRLAGLFVILAFATPILYSVQVVFVWTSWWTLVGHIAVPPVRPAWAALTLGSPNLVVTVLLLLCPAAVGVIAGLERSARSRIGLAACAVLLAVLAAVLTGSRGGALGIAGAGAATLLLILGRARRLSRRVRVLTLVLVAAMAASLLVVVIARGGQGGEGLRLELWRTAAVVLFQHPLFGGGPNTWALLKLFETRPFEPVVLVPHAHNLYLWTLAELGLVGTGAVSVFVGLILVRLLRRTGSSEIHVAAPAAAALVAIAGIAAQSTVDVVTNLPGVVVLLSAVVAFGLAAEVERTDSPSAWATVATGTGASRRHLAGIAIAAMLVLLLGAGFLRANQAEQVADGARAALRDGVSAGAQRDFAVAAGMDPLPLYRHEEGLAAAFSGDGATAMALTQETVAQDGLAHHRILLAYLRVGQGDMAGAIASAREAMGAGWPDPGVMLNAARIGELAHDTALAQDGLVLAASLAPTTLGDPYWRSAQRSLPFDELVGKAAAVAMEHDGLAGSALVKGFAKGTDAASADLSALVPSDAVRIGAVITSATDPEAAIATLTSWLAANPQDWSAAAWLAWIEAGAGRRHASEAHAWWALVLQGDAAPGVVAVPRRIGGATDLPQFRQPGLYAWAPYQQDGSGLLFGPGSVTLVP